MLDKKLSNIRSNLKRAFPEISKEIDNLVGLMFEEMLEGDHEARSAIQNLEKDLVYTLEAHGLQFDLKQIRNLLK